LLWYLSREKQHSKTGITGEAQLQTILGPLSAALNDHSEDLEDKISPYVEYVLFNALKFRDPLDFIIDIMKTIPEEPLPMNCLQLALTELCFVIANSKQGFVGHEIYDACDIIENMHELLELIENEEAHRILTMMSIDTLSSIDSVINDHESNVSMNDQAKYYSTLVGWAQRWKALDDAGYIDFDLRNSFMSSPDEFLASACHSSYIIDFLLSLILE
jgi:hypothetical protein